MVGLSRESWTALAQPTQIHLPTQRRGLANHRERATRAKRLTECVSFGRVDKKRAELTNAASPVGISRVLAGNLALWKFPDESPPGVVYWAPLMTDWNTIPGWFAHWTGACHPPPLSCREHYFRTVPSKPPLTNGKPS